jgi:hypothetical protein
VFTTDPQVPTSINQWYVIYAFETASLNDLTWEVRRLFIDVVSTPEVFGPRIKWSVVNVEDVLKVVTE